MIVFSRPDEHFFFVTFVTVHPTRALLSLSGCNHSPRVTSTEQKRLPFSLSAPDATHSHRTMVRSGKEPAAPDDASTQLSWQEVRRLNGINRQLRPDSAAQRLAASQAAAAKRRADAMPADERKARVHDPRHRHLRQTQIQMTLTALRTYGTSPCLHPFHLHVWLSSRMSPSSGSAVSLIQQASVLASLTLTWRSWH